MSVDIKICSLAEVLATNQKFDFIVSTVDEEDGGEMSLISEKANGFHYFDFFYDIEDDTPGGPTEHQINKLTIFLAGIPDNCSVLFHCYMGMCRSTAAAMMLFHMRGSTPEEALKNVLKLRSHALPNTRMLKFYDDIFNLGENGLFKPTNERAEGMLLKTRNLDDILLF